MNILVFYFSGAGSTKQVAECMRKLLPMHPPLSGKGIIVKQTYNAIKLLSFASEKSGIGRKGASFEK